MKIKIEFTEKTKIEVLDGQRKLGDIELSKGAFGIYCWFKQTHSKLSVFQLRAIARKMRAFERKHRWKK